MKFLYAALLTLSALPAIAEGSRELGAHEHGIGELKIAVDDEMIAMEFHAPGADIVGFEYEATSAEDRAAIDDAVAILAKPLELFVLPAAAKCNVTQASAGLESEEEHDNHDHDDHAEDDAHNHDDHAEAETGHTEFHAEYTLACGNTDALSDITFAYFEMFENAVELEVQIVTSVGAQAFEVSRDVPKIDLRGLF